MQFGTKTKYGAIVEKLHFWISTVVKVFLFQIGHLTRNVKLRGNVNKSHIEKVDACPQSFNPDQFATQTCFQGRYGEFP